MIRDKKQGTRDKGFLRKSGMVFSLFVLCLSLVACPLSLVAEEENLPPKDLIIRAWESWSTKDYDKTFYYTDKCIELYSEKAAEEQASLEGLPPAASMSQYEALNAVGTSYFIRGEAYLYQGKIENAKEAFITVIEKYGFAQNWDPRGWFWSVKEKSMESLAKLEQKDKELPERLKETPQTKITLYEPGKDELVDYRKYGYFKDIGTENYRYIVKDPEGLAEAVGEGIYPNTSGVIWDPRYQELSKLGRLEGNHWDFVNTDDLEANFYKWTQAPEPPGVRQFYTALTLEKSGLLKQAIKAYYAIAVHFPKSVGWTYFHTPWYVGQVAIDRIDYLLRKYPELGMELKGAKIFVENGFDNTVSNDRHFVNPGELKQAGFFSKIKRNLFKCGSVNTGKVMRQIGDGKVDLVKYENDHWQLRVEGRPYIIKGIAYSPSRVGQSPDEGTLDDWMQADYDGNGRIDGPYDSWVDRNYNNIKDPDEEAIGDFELLKRMNCNTIRIYHHASNKKLLRDLYQRYGIMVIMGDLFGAYTVGSGAGWYEGTDYENPVHRKNMIKSVKKMVAEFKDEPYVLFWILGNENNYGVANNAKENPSAYYAFANEVSRVIKSMDRDHPVAICNGDLLFLDEFSKLCPDIDIYGTNAYRGSYGFGRSFWGNVKEVADKPVLVTEYGCPSYMKGKPKEFAEIKQAEYLKESWQDVIHNSAGCKGIGNSIGGILFEWLDEWWKAYEPLVHDVNSNWAGPFPDGWNYEEWLGVAGQGDGEHSPFLRQLRKSYFVYQEIWKE